jgi:hypothetical protein
MPDRATVNEAIKTLAREGVVQALEYQGEDIVLKLGLTLADGSIVTSLQPDDVDQILNRYRSRGFGPYEI